MIAAVQISFQVQVLQELAEIGTRPDWRWAFAWTFVAVEVLTFVPSFLLTISQSAALFGTWRKQLRLVGPHVPRVDIMITCCNEPLHVLRDTINGTLAIDYPTDRYRVIVADDGANHELRDFVASLKRNNVYYKTRPKSSPPDFKAGNLNHTIRYMETLPGGASPLLASLDADMIPEKRWLRCVVAHIVTDPKMGLVFPSQSFYNTPMNDLLCQDNRFFWSVNDIYRDLLASACNTGSGFLLRREAILDIGGFPAPSILEDIYSSMLMMSKGWKTAYLAEALQYGLVPSSYLGSIKQFTRWHVGGFQLVLHFRFYIFRRWTGKLTSRQRLTGFYVGVTGFFEPIFQTLFAIFGPLLLVTEGSLLYFRDYQTTILLIRLQCITAVWFWLDHSTRAILTGYRPLWKAKAINTYMAPYYTLAFLRSFLLPFGLGGTTPGFTPSGSIANLIHERDPQRRAPLRLRARHMLLDCGVLCHVILLVASVLAMAYRIWSTVLAVDGTGSGSVKVRLLQDVAWLLPTWLEFTAAFSIPVQYLFWPPDVAPRDAVMCPPDADGARYAQDWSRDCRTSTWTFGFVELQGFLVVYHIILFAATFIYF
ncbi:nucleotide-diphospho-sugar transferase [Xylariomycetidae sp. FL2044]|nr:nucleotide-diphospho-sugar transferase [Xylariomycetidae sp. FL2044]